MNRLSQELVGIIEEFKPVHPLKRKIDDWLDYGKRRPYFYKYYFRRKQELQDKIKRNEEHKNWHFRCMLEDGFTSEQTVKLNYKSKLEKQRLNKRLAELGIEKYMISTVTHFPKLNKHGNFSEAYHNNVEIIF